MPTCTKCGAKLPRGASFCPSCGERVVRTSRSPSTAELAKLTAAQETIKEYKSAAYWLIVGGGIVMILLGSLLILAGFSFASAAALGISVFIPFAAFSIYLTLKYTKMIEKLRRGEVE